MSFQWLRMRITEEQDRRDREGQIQERLPRAVADVKQALAACVESYTSAFGKEAAELQIDGWMLRVMVREQLDGNWQERTQVEIEADTALPGFRINREGLEPLMIEVGLLPGDKLFYRDRVLDQYVSMDEITHRALDRAFFPKLRD
jgi:hypothetical protein